MTDILLEMRNITKSFSGVNALENVSFTVKRGSIHALVGENGAGKSTLMNILSGVYPYGSYTGDILLENEKCRFSDIKSSEKAGIAIIHQELALIPFMSIGENIFLGNERGRKFALKWDETYKQAAEYLKMAGLTESPYTLVKDLGIGKQQLVEVAKALSKNAKLLILDEPTASLNEAESLFLLDLIIKLKNEGITSVIISHKLNEISYVADEITVMRDGKTVETIEKKDGPFSEDRIIRSMVGREISNRYPKRVKDSFGEKTLEVRNWKVFHPVYHETEVVRDVSFYVRQGEIVGIYGLVGAGRTELAMSIFGKSYGSKISGTILLNGKPVNFRTPQQAIENGIAYVTEDRKDNGLILSESIRFNITLANLKGVSSHGKISFDNEYAISEQYRNLLQMKSHGVDQKVQELSGGTQQKTLLAKWMFSSPDILILDEPTRGIDVGAKYEIYGIINQLADEGRSVIMISSELPEVLGMSDRIYVMYEGSFVGEFKRGEATQEMIMSCMLKKERGNPNG